jgi:hypothetical protein
MEMHNREAAGARGVEKIPICRRKIARRLARCCNPLSRDITYGWTSRMAGVFQKTSGFKP